MIFKYIILLSTLFLTLIFARNEGTCWIIDDQTQTLYTFNMQTLDAPIETTIDKVNEGEGLAYRPSTHELYMWDNANTIVRNADTGIAIRQYPTSYANQVEGASFYIDPISKEEELWVIVEDRANNYNPIPLNSRYIQKVNIDTGSVISGTRKKLIGGFINTALNWGTDIGSLAIDPKTKQFWITQDSYTRKLAKLDPSTGQVTDVITLRPTDTVDAEVLAFDINGFMYTESDRGENRDDPRYLWKINATSGNMEKATPQFGIGTDGDLEGMACNAGADVIANERDYGDAPTQYTHVSHKISSNLYLGNNVPDSENDQQSTTDATGDGDDDNDGIINLPVLNIGDETYTVSAKVFNNTRELAYITAWIDFNRNGTFEYEEALNTNDLQVSPSNSTQTINIQWSNSFENQLENLTAGKAIMRIRLSTSRILRCDDPHYKDRNGTAQENYFISPDGEVEDYEISIKEIITDPFTCDDTLYLSNRSELGSGRVDDTGATWLHSINREVNPYSYTTIGNHGYPTNDDGYNAIGYNINDDFIYAMHGKNLLKINSKATVSDLGEVQGYPHNTQLYVGEFDRNGSYYVTYGDNLSNNPIYQIDVTQNKVTKTIPFILDEGIPRDVKFWDIAIDKSGKFFYAMLLKEHPDKKFENYKVAKIEIATGKVTTIGENKSSMPSSIAMTFSDVDGELFMMSEKNGFYKVNTVSGDMSLISPTLDLTFYNDGTSCPNGDITVDSPPFLGTFNVERINSGNYTLGTNERNAWYTQIVGRDFDYSVLFYDENGTALKEISNATIKIELINQDTNITLYELHAYIAKENPTSRIDVKLPIDDLNKLPATKKAIFRISYGVDANNSIIQADCSNSIYKACYERDTSTHLKTDYAKDNFAIRPDVFHLTINDKNQTRLNSRVDENITLAAGYDYNLTVVATTYSDDTASKGYSKPADSSMNFTATGRTCINTLPIAKSISFIDGHFHDLSFTHHEVGEYLIKIEDDKVWTEVDQNSTILGCIKNSGERIANAEGKVGCDIVVDKFDTQLTFRPYKFAINLASNNLPSNSHPNFIYMSELSKDYYDTAIQFTGDIIAQTEDNQTTRNFTTGCFAQDITLIPNAVLETEDGNIVFPDKILTAQYDENRSRTEVKINRMERFNNEDFNVTTVNQIDHITELLTIQQDKFLNENNGTVTLDLRYNIQKTLNQPINPIKITFNSLNIEALLDYSEANGTSNFIPTGVKDYGSMVRNFYFSQVAPDLIHYPRINFLLRKTVNTPLNVDIFCNSSEEYCRKTKIFDNTSLESSPRKQKGWVLSINHDRNNDGDVTTLTPNPSNVTPPAAPISFTKGRRDGLDTTIDTCNTPTLTKVTIGTDPALRYNPHGLAPYYTVECTPTNPSEWTGIGKTGYVLDINASVNSTGKVDW